MTNNIKNVLNTINFNSCPFEINFHCHSTYSDGSLSAMELYAQAINIGLNHLCITDHHSINAYIQISSLIRNGYYDDDIKIPNIWIGSEISCLINKKLVHLLAFDFDYNSKSMNRYLRSESTKGIYLQADYLINTIHESGGLAILAHPARYNVNYKKLLYDSMELGIDGSEVWYDYTYSKHWSPTPFICESIDSIMKSNNLLSSCGTDTHGSSLLCR